jgi:hypothetical protein
MGFLRRKWQHLDDKGLINPWGIAFPPTGPFWIANNHTGTATLYSVDQNTDATTVNPLVVTIAPPPDQTGPAAPDRHSFQ